MKSVSEIRPVKREAEEKLLARSGVTGVDIGHKIVGGQRTDDLAIRVYVDKKRDVSAKQKIPKTISGIKTDVIQRKFVLHPLLKNVAEIELKADTGTYDPVKGGMSIGPCRAVYLDDAEAACQGAGGAGWYLFVGTLGALVRDNATGAEMLLSNFHVMCVDDGWSVGDTMAQPSRVDGGSCPADIVGALQRASLGGQVDCAVSSHTARGHSCSILDIGGVTGTASAADGMSVRKRGRTTGLTYGNVDTVDLTVTINYCNGLGSITLTDQIGIEVDESQSAMFGDNGDSGSVVVDDSRRVVGLYFAGSSDGTYGVANPINAVLSALNVSICQAPQICWRPPSLCRIAPTPCRTLPIHVKCPPVPLECYRAPYCARGPDIPCRSAPIFECKYAPVIECRHAPVDVGCPAGPWKMPDPWERIRDIPRDWRWTEGEHHGLVPAMVYVNEREAAAWQAQDAAHLAAIGVQGEYEAFPEHRGAGDFDPHIDE